MKKILPYIAIAILLFLLLRQCSVTYNLKSQSNNAQIFLNDTIEYYQNELGQEVAEKIALKGDKNQLEILLSNQIDSTKQLRNLLKDYKKVYAAGNITTVTKIDTVKIYYEKPIPINFFRKWEKKTDEYFISGASNQLGVSLDKIEIPNTLSFAIGDKKKGFWKNSFEINAVNSNTYVKTTGLDSYTYSEPVKRFGISLYAGYGLSSNFTFQPSIGIAATFTFLRF